MRILILSQFYKPEPVPKPHELAEAIASAMYTALTDDPVSGQLRQAALTRAQAFTWEETARQTLQVYEQAWGLAQGACQ